MTLSLSKDNYQLKARFIKFLELYIDHYLV